MAPLLLLQLLLLSIATATNAQSQTCRRSQCAVGSPIIRFPFRLSGSQPRRCGYPGFDLSCNEKNQTIIKFPRAGEFAVELIDYMAGVMWISDPDKCMARRLLNNLGVPHPFRFFGYEERVTFLNCTSDAEPPEMEKVGCLSGGNYTVGVVEGPVPHGPCRVISSGKVVRGYDPRLGGPLEGVLLGWAEPDCVLCELEGMTCGYTSNSSLRVGCSPDSPSTATTTNKDIPKVVKYGLVIGVGVPGLLVAMAIVLSVSGKMAARARRRQQLNTVASTSVAPSPMIIRIGLDGPTIESYPKTMLGGSKRLPNPSDNTCAICLSDYQSNESLRTIPQCKHYFHTDCIDKWLQLNGTCPICRNSPGSSSISRRDSTILPS